MVVKTTFLFVVVTLVASSLMAGCGQHRPTPDTALAGIPEADVAYPARAGIGALEVIMHGDGSGKLENANIPSYEQVVSETESATNEIPSKAFSAIESESKLKTESYDSKEVAPLARTGLFDQAESSAYLSTSGVGCPAPKYVTWPISGESVDRYHFKFGPSPDSLNTELIVPVEQIEKFDHPKLGPVFRIALPQIGTSSELFVSLSAENRFGRSDFSEPKKIPY